MRSKADGRTGGRAVERKDLWNRPMVASLLGVGLFGCSEPVCDICTTSAIVYGTVRRSGSPISGASVTVTPIRDSCSSGQLALGGELTTSTVADGSYRAHSRTPDGPFTACIRIAVLENGAPGGTPVTVDGGTVDFRPDNAGQNRDSVRVNADLP